jgi:hypothetical protein
MPSLEKFEITSEPRALPNGQATEKLPRFKLMPFDEIKLDKSPAFWSKDSSHAPA